MNTYMNHFTSPEVAWAGAAATAQISGAGSKQLLFAVEGSRSDESLAPLAADAPLFSTPGFVRVLKRKCSTQLESNAARSTDNIFAAGGNHCPVARPSRAGFLSALFEWQDPKKRALIRP